MASRWGAPAPITIMATKDVVDTVTTEQLKEAAARAVEPSYKRAEKDVAAQVLSAMDQSFAQLAQIANTQPGATADGISDAALEEAKEQFAPVQIEKTQLAALMSCRRRIPIAALFQATRTLVNDALNSYISEGQESDTGFQYRARIGQNIRYIARGARFQCGARAYPGEYDHR